MINNNKKVEEGGGVKQWLPVILYMDTSGYYHHVLNLGSHYIKFKTTNNFNWFLYS